ncbi:hypothetical protein EC957_002016 [Mortierella hygrophila]|uniref:Mediator of RNA polymerase II transcription subunit 1 n=1 Tax=Mortierella hygrophila TaxID=979708 RepID=A0A9P6FGZ0_9FUNG|nr:hypothetical protein EC957_002016 [Mortierella hygrophila]
MPNISNATTVQEHLRDLHTLVEDSLKQWNLSTNSTAATALVGQAHPNRLSHELHPLGPVQVGMLQKDFKEKIAAIRAICLSFAQGPLHQSISVGDASSTSAFRKYSTLLKEETQLEEALSSVKASMTQCQNTLRAASQDGGIKKDHLLGSIKEMATGLGLECYLDTGSRPYSALPVSILTIGGIVIVVDIEVESTGAILKVKVSFFPEIHQDERVDRLLASNLRCKCGKLLQTEDRSATSNLLHLPDCSRNFDAFSKNLKALAVLDNFQKKYPVDFFHNMRAMDLDLKELFRREMLLTNNDIERVFKHGHGIPMTHAVLPGPSVAYWAPKSELLDVSWSALATAIEQGANEKVKIPFHRISITMEESTASASGYLPADRAGFLLSEEETQTLSGLSYGSIMNDQGSVGASTILQQPLRWVVPTSDSTIEATYVAILHPPVVVSEDLAKQLAALSNQAGFNTMGLNRDQGYLSLQELLVNRAIEQTQWEIVLDQGPNAVRQLFSFDRTKCEARLLHRIPFTHISQVYMCTKLLRQQMVFNALFQSCFKETSSPEEIKKRLTAAHTGNGEDNDDSNDNVDTTSEVAIIIQTPQPPNIILATFINPFTETSVRIEIVIDPVTASPTVRLDTGMGHASPMMGFQTGGEFQYMQQQQQQQDQYMQHSLQQQQQDVFVVDSVKLTQVLLLCDSIPILVRWILKRSFVWMKERHQLVGRSGSVQSGRRPSSHTEDGGILKRPRV